MAKESGIKVIARNRKAHFNYQVEDTLECGIALEGTEVKSVKEGTISFPDAFAEVVNGELLLKGMHISEYAGSAHFVHDPDRHKKLLAHAIQIKKLDRKVNNKGYTLIPLEFYVKNGLVKVSLGVCRGKKLYDKRETIKSRDLNRETEREFRRRQE